MNAQTTKQKINGPLKPIPSPPPASQPPQSPNTSPIPGNTPSSIPSTIPNPPASTTPSQTPAQTPSTGSKSTNLPVISGTDQEQISQIMQRVFDAMRNVDTTGLRAFFDPNCSLLTPSMNKYNQMVLAKESINDFINFVGSPRKEFVDERVIKNNIQIDGPMASAWADYNLYIDGKILHCGVDAFQLYKSDTGWKIFGLADTRRKSGCNPDPKDEVATFLDKWHSDAANANADSYFGAMTADGIFLGTDASERWTREEFRAWAKSAFDARKTWNFKPSKRNINLESNNSLAWFDEQLSTSMGPCRGSGVLVKTGDGWKIKQYNLAVELPNEKLSDYLKLIKN